VELEGCIGRIVRYSAGGRSGPQKKLGRRQERRDIQPESLAQDSVHAGMVSIDIAD